MGAKPVVLMREEKEDAGPRPEDLLFEKITGTVPDLLKEVNQKKSSFVLFCRNTWIDQRETTLDTLEDATARFKMQDQIEDFYKLVRKISIAFKMLILVLSFYVSFGLLTTLLVICLSDEFLNAYREVESEKIREKIRSLSPVFESDRSSTEKARLMFSDFEKSLFELRDEIDDFIRTVRFNFLDVEVKTPGMKRFFTQVSLLKSKDKEDMRKYLQAFLELIHNFNAAQKIFDEARGPSKSNKSYEDFLEQCKFTGAQISTFLEDINFCYSKMEITDVGKMAMDIAVSRLQDVPKKMQKMREILDKNKENVTKNTSGIDVKRV